ncbi:MAG: hypothetical protein RLZZ275_609 [Bacteroidota bacterium]
MLEWEAREVEEPATGGSGRSEFARWLADRAGKVGFETAAAAKEEGTVRRPEEVIDRFIRASPRIGRLREEQNPRVVDLARASVEEQEELVTETMALLYVRQGQVERARRAYAQLALKYPEKSTYFAAALKNLG